MPLPKIIALCGKPGSGKSTAAELLQETYGYQLVDDCAPMRDIAMRYLGLTEHQVSTGAGKREQVELNGRTWTCREILGEIGNAFEEKFGNDIIPMMSFNQMDPDRLYVLGSVRRDQGHYWRSKGAVVIEIDRPDVEPSPYEFDRYSLRAIDHTVTNDFPDRAMHEDDALQALIEALAKVIEG